MPQGDRERERHQDRRRLERRVERQERRRPMRREERGLPRPREDRGRPRGREGAAGRERRYPLWKENGRFNLVSNKPSDCKPSSSMKITLCYGEM